MVAKILGPVYLIVGVALLLNGAYYKKVFEVFMKNEALMYYGGVISLIFGLLIVQTHNVWVANWSVVITLVGWMAVVKGARLLMFPQATEHWKKFILKGKGVMFAKVTALVLGGFLTWMGFFA